MADDINGIIESLKALGKNTKALEDLARKLPTREISQYGRELIELDKIKKRVAKTDAAALIMIEKQMAANLRLIEAKAKLAEADKENKEAVQSGNNISEEAIENYERLQKEVDKYENSITELRAAQIKADEAARDNFRTNTVLGKAYSAVTGSLGRFTAGLAAGSLAMKAFNRFATAAQLRQDLFIKSYQSMDQLKHEGLITAAYRANSFEQAIRAAQVTAIRFGVSVDEVVPTMERFSRITGSTNAAALGKMTEAAISVAKYLGVDVGEATEFISTRMEKFGGNVASAATELKYIRTFAERSNTAFTEMGKQVYGVGSGIQVTVLRADDLSRALLGLARDQSIYALNQRFLVNTLSDTTRGLQSTGESYEFAQRAATDYVEAVTIKAPEWTKIVAGERLTREFQRAFKEGGDSGKKDFLDKFGKDLDAAKPGLSKKVMEILGPGGPKSFYAKSRLIQQLVQGTEAGMKTMNDIMLQMYEQSGQDLTVIAQQYFGGDFIKADAAVKNAKLVAASQKDVEKAFTLSGEELRNYLDIKDLQFDMSRLDVAQAEREGKSVEEIEKRKALVRNMVQEKIRRGQEETFGKTLADQDKMTKELKEKAMTEIAALDREIAGTADGAVRKGLEARKLELEQTITAAAPKFDTQEQILTDIRDGLKPFFTSRSVLTGDIFKEVGTSLSSLPGLIAGAIGGFFLGGRTARVMTLAELYFAKELGAGTLIKNLLSKFPFGRGGGPTGGAGAGGGVIGRMAGGLGKLTGLFSSELSDAASTVGRGASSLLTKGVAKMAAPLEKVGAGAALKTGGKLLGKVGALGGKTLGRFLPGVGLAMAGMEAYELLQKYQRGEEITRKDLAVLGTSTAAGVAGLFPGIGTGVSAAINAAAIGTQFLPESDKQAKEITESLKAQAVLPEDYAARKMVAMQTSVAPAATAMAAPMARTAPTATTSGAPGTMPTATAGAVNPDGSVNIRVTNFLEAWASAAAYSQNVR